VLHQIVRMHLTTFLRAAEAGGGVPSFVEREFRQFVGCGVWARGFARFRCEACHAERLVPFSCKARAVCPSCGGRRMAERAAHLVDRVLPAVPIRQWVLSLPFRLRYVLAWNHPLCRAVLGVHVRALRGFYRRRARRQGVADGETGTVTAIQRFGSALNLNVHLHTLAVDGVFAPDAQGEMRFVPATPPTAPEIARLVAAIATRVARLLRRHGISLDGEEARGDETAAPEDASALAALAAASVTGRSLLGQIPGARVQRLGADPARQHPVHDTPWHARHAGFDLHGGRTVRADDRAGLERLCHYLLRPPLAQERIEILPDGRVGLTLAHPWADGTRALIFAPVEFLEKLAVLIPKPRINLLIYHGVLGARARHRPAAVASAGPPPVQEEATSAPADAPAATPSGPPTRRGYVWAELLRRIFQIDVLACECGGRLRFMATIEDPPVVQRILRHLGLPTDTPALAPARSPPSGGGNLIFDFPE
jgi:Putative transposase/Transposase zinc-binding domain